MLPTPVAAAPPAKGRAGAPAGSQGATLAGRRSRIRGVCWLMLGIALTWSAPPAHAQSGRRVALTGSMGDRALLAIDGAAPRVVAVGTTVVGVRLLRMDGNEAVVEVDGRRQTLRLGEAAVNLGGAASSGSGTEIKLTSDARGHFIANGQINGRGATFMVDTGASTIALGRSDAERMGLAYQQGQRVPVNTANGVVIAHRVALNSVRIGDVEVFNVEALVNPLDMPYVLLGNSFLTRFQMRRDNDTLTLSRR